MCPWCVLTPACPCRRGGGPPSLTLGKALVAVARRSWRLGSRLAQRRSDVSMNDRVAAASAQPVRVRSHRQTKEEHHDTARVGLTMPAGRFVDFVRSMLGLCANSQQPAADDR